MDNIEKNSSEEVKEIKPQAVESQADEKKAEEETGTKAIEADKAPEAEKSEVKESSQKVDPEVEKKFEEIFESLKEIKEKNDSIEVEVLEKAWGGLRVAYKDMPLFLPQSHFLLKRSPSQEELDNAVGQKFIVKVTELQKDDTGRRTVVVSRRDILEEEFWSSISVGDKVKGKVSSIPKFGVFLDLGGYEGLIHISRLAKVRVENPKDIVKIGDELDAVILDIDKENKRISLSHQEFTDSPWKGLAEKYPEGSKTKGIVRRFTNFGVFVEIEPGIDGLLRAQELSWTRRIGSPKEVLKKDEEIEIVVLDVDEEKERISLSLKQATENPWPTLETKYPKGAAYTGIIKNVVDQGVVVMVESEVDGFIPKSKFSGVGFNQKLPLKSGDELEVVVEEVVIDKNSMILKPKEENIFAGVELEEDPNIEVRGDKKGGGPRRQGGNRPPASKIDKSFRADEDGSSFSIADLLPEDMKDDLKN